MSHSVSIAKAKADFAALVARAEAGEAIIISRNGRPVAQLTPPPKQRKQKIVMGDLIGMRISDDLSLPQDIIDLFYESSLFP